MYLRNIDEGCKYLKEKFNLWLLIKAQMNIII
jgi:hypothetical protein